MADGYLTFDTRVDSKGFNQGTKGISKGMGVASNSLKKFGTIAKIAFSTTAAVAFGKASVSAATEAQNAMQGLKSILDGQGKSFSNAKGFIDEYIADGLIPMSNAVTAYKNLAARGYDEGQIQSTMTALKDSAAYGRQASYTLGDAVTSATEGLKNENSILVDNAGVTKNVAKMWDDYAKSIGTTSNKLTQQQKIQAEVNGILEETRFQTGDAAKVADSYSGSLSKLSAGFQALKVSVGLILTKALKPVVDYLAIGITKLSTFIATITEALGIADSLVGDTSDVSKNAQKASDSYADMAESAEDAQKANADSLASFDKINKLGGEDNKTNTSTPGITPVTVPTINAALDVTTSNATQKIKSFIADLKNRFSGIGEHIKQSFGTTWDGLWSGLTTETQTLSATMSGIFSDIKGLGPMLLEYLSGDFTTCIVALFSFLSTVVTGLFNSFNTVFSDIWDVVLYPTLENLLGVVLPVLTQFTTEAYRVLEVLFTEIKTLFDVLWNEAIKPVLGLVMQIWIDLTTLIKNKWDEYGAPIFVAIRKAVTATGEIFRKVWNDMLKPIFNILMAKIAEIWNGYLKPLIGNLVSFVAEFAQAALDIYNNFIAPVVKWIVDKFSTPFIAAFHMIADVVGSTIKNLIRTVDGIIDTFRALMRFIKGVFTKDWDMAWRSVKEIFASIFKSLVNIVRGPINLIIGIINAMINGIVAGVNTVIRAINSIKITFPDWVPGLGGKGFDPNIREVHGVQIPEVPRLAKGAVIPPNQEFLAVLGDQKQGTNIETPLSTMVQAFKTALSDMNTCGSNVTVVLEGDVKRLFKAIVDENNKNTINTGRNAFVW